jgi:hypothetical protein
VAQNTPSSLHSNSLSQSQHLFFKVTIVKEKKREGKGQEHLSTSMKGEEGGCRSSVDKKTKVRTDSELVISVEDMKKMCGVLKGVELSPLINKFYLKFPEVRRVEAEDRRQGRG